MTIILYAIPFFLLLIVAELLLDRYRGTGYFRFADSVSSLNAGILSRVTQVFWRLVPLVMYIHTYQHWALFNLPVNWMTWLTAFVFYDLCYYWHHRLGHERNFLWASHVVHHSSEEYNLTTALRQSSGSLVGWIFYLPMALLGFDPLQFASVAALNLIYQFWVHSRHVPKLGWYERWFITPSNHRVHHAINDCYIDRNYGGVFIIWDRLFGTFQEELDKEPCVYGIRKPLNSWNPIWTNLHYYVQLMRDSFFTRRWQDKFRVWFGRTGWRPEDVAERFPLPAFDLTKITKYQTEIATPVSSYVLLQLLIIIAALAIFMAASQKLNGYHTMVFGVGIVFSCTSLGLLLERHQLAIVVEHIRLALVAILAWWLVSGSLHLVLCLASIGLLMIWVQRLAAWNRVPAVPVD